MEVPPAEIIDRISIVKLKIERIGKPELHDEFSALKKALSEFENKGVKIEDSWIEELYEINKKEWDLLEAMNKEREGEKNYAKIGELYLET